MEKQHNKTFCIGDIHANYRGLLQCLKRSKFDKEKDVLICLGDYCDGWSETPECINELLTIKNRIDIRGNHDNWCDDWLSKGWTPSLWTQQGGQATIDAYIRTGELINDKHREFFNNLQDYYIDNQNRLFIHGGWDYYMGFPNGALFPVNAGSKAKECHWDRSLLAGARSAFGDKNNPKGKFNAIEQFKEVYIGHTAMNGLPHQFGNLWNMDTGSGFSGYLSIINIDTKEVYQSDNVLSLYPDEKGRR